MNLRRGTTDSEQMVDLSKVMMRYLDMSQHAIDCVFSHGQVRLDGRVLAQDERRIPWEPARGALLEVPGRQIRLGVRPIRETLFDA